MNMIINELERVAVDSKMLATNFTDVVPDCTGVGGEPKVELMNRHPLYNWLINTTLSARVRGLINGDRGQCILHQDANGKYVIEIPETYWSLPPQSSAEECCWQPFDFAKCAGNVPINRLCLKDCDNIDDEILGRVVRMRNGYGELARAGETVWSTKKRIARLSMAFLTAYNAILGMDDSATNILKPFHGLLQVMSNPAVQTIEGADILSASDSLACRITALGFGEDEYVFAVNPIIYNSILTQVTISQYGNYPMGWSRSGDEVTFRGIRFIRDRHVPVDLETGFGEVWVLSREAVGLWMVTDLMPADAFIKESGHQEQSLADGCGSSCTYYYNYGAAFSNNANKLMRIINVPVSANCAGVVEDLAGLAMPETLIPQV